MATWLSEAEKEAAIRGRLIHESDDPDVCLVSVTTGISTYTLHPKLFELDYLGFSIPGANRKTTVRLVSALILDSLEPDWRNFPQGRPQYAIQSDKTLRLVPTPSMSGELYLEGYRMPLASLDSDDSEPEILEAHHIHLVDWAIMRAFSLPDAETQDVARAGVAEQTFSAYFGISRDADMRRSSAGDFPPHNVADWV